MFLLCNFQKVDARLKDASVNYKGGKISVRALNYHLNNLQKFEWLFSLIVKDDNLKILKF